MLAGYINDADLLRLSGELVAKVTRRNSGAFKFGDNSSSVVVKLDPESDTPGQIIQAVADRGEIYHFKKSGDGIKAVFADPEKDSPLESSDRLSLARELLRYYPL